MSEMEIVARYFDELPANLAKARLEGEGIDAVVVGRSIQHFSSAMGGAAGPVQLLVSAEYLDHARSVLRDFEAELNRSEQVESRLCPHCGSAHVGPDPFRKWCIVMTILTCGLLFSTIFLSRKHACRECGCRW